jgi:hypothetical protein
MNEVEYRGGELKLSAHRFAARQLVSQELVTA